jgi:hypothetical protein
MICVQLTNGFGNKLIFYFYFDKHTKVCYNDIKGKK